jgi:hypothetical protein
MITDGLYRSLRSWPVLHEFYARVAILKELYLDDIALYGGTVPGPRDLLDRIGLTVRSLELCELFPLADSSRFCWLTNRYAE